MLKRKAQYGNTDTEDECLEAAVEDDEEGWATPRNARVYRILCSVCSALLALV